MKPILLRFLAHDWRRGRRTMLIPTCLIVFIYATAILRPYVEALSSFVTFAVSLLGTSGGLAVLLIAMSSLAGSWRDGTSHLLLSLPARGRDLLWARFFSIALPAIGLLLPSWPVLLVNFVPPFEVGFYLEQLPFIKLPLQEEFVSQAVLPAGHAAVIVAIALKTLFFTALGILVFALSQWSSQAGRLGWLVSALVYLVVLSSIGFVGNSLMAILIAELRLVGFLDLSCAGWWFGITDCSISVLAILLMLTLCGAFMWLSIWSWDRRLEA